MVYEIATFRRPSQYNIEEHDPKEPPKFPSGNQNNSSSTTPHLDVEAPDTPAPSNFEIDDEFNLPITVALTILILYIIFGAFFYSVFEENWGFFGSFYFVFISMSTIGFGDFVPKEPICMIASIVYLVFGLALMSMCINVVQLKLSDTFRQASAKLGATIGLRVADEDGSITTIPPLPIEIADVHTTNTKDNVQV